MKSVSLNQGEAFTTSLNTTIYSNGGSYEMLKLKISENEDCTCGTWETYSAAKAYILKNANSLNKISIQFRDFEGKVSRCHKLQITHDDIAPKVTAELDPSNTYLEPATTRILLNTEDLGSGLQSVSCKLNGQPVVCSSGNSSVTIANQISGAYTFEVTAKDNLNLTSTASLAWSVTIPYKQITQSWELKSNNKVDILLIDDNSGSMEFEQKSMAKRMSTFLNVLKGLDWRIGITTTDPDDIPLGDGRLVKTTGPLSGYYISSSMDANKAQTTLEQTIQRKEVGSGNEQGIKMTYRSIERSLDPKDPNSSFYRNDAHFAAVVISDEDESDTQFKNIPENLLAYVNKLWPQKNFAFHSIITKPGDNACLKTEGYAYGSVYEKMSKLTGNGMIGGAIIGSVCETDYGSQLSGIGKSAQEMRKIIDLDCEPVGPSDSAVLVSLDGSNYTDKYSITGQRLVFDNPLATGQYKLEYKCKL